MSERCSSNIGTTRFQVGIYQRAPRTRINPRYRNESLKSAWALCANARAHGEQKQSEDRPSDQAGIELISPRRVRPLSDRPRVRLKGTGFAATCGRWRTSANAGEFGAGGEGGIRTRVAESAPLGSRAISCRHLFNSCAHFAGQRHTEAPDFPYLSVRPNKVFCHK